MQSPKNRCDCCGKHDALFTLCSVCSQMAAILTKFGKNEVESSDGIHTEIRTLPNRVMWEVTAQCKESRQLGPGEYRYLTGHYREAIRSALEAAGKPLPWLGKESAEPATVGDAGGSLTSGDVADRGASTEH